MSPRLLLCATPLVVGAAACTDNGGKPKIPIAPAADPTEVVLSLDGVAITRGEIDVYSGYFESISPTTGDNARIRFALDQHLIPLAFARREFDDPRAIQRERARALAATLGDSAGYDELRERTVRIESAELQEGIVRQHLPLPEQRWLFADENLGRVSPVLETAQGFSLVAAIDKVDGQTKAFDQIDAFLVRFYTHRAKAYADWYDDLKQRLGNLAPTQKIVHPDYRDGLPPWLRYR